MQTSSPSGLTSFLRRLEVHASLTHNDGQALLNLPHSIKLLRRHDFIVRDGESPKQCCIMTSGFAIRHKTASNGGRQIFSIHMRGEPVDLNNSLLGRADHNIQMLSRGEIVCAPVEAVRALTQSHPRLGQAMWYETLVDSAVLREWTLNSGRRDAMSSLAHLLCEFALRMQGAGLGSSRGYELPMSHEELADALSLTSVHVSRMLKLLAAEGSITRTNRSVKILDWHDLVKIADFDPAYLHLLGASERPPIAA